MKQRHEAEVAQLVSARLSELGDRQFDPRHSTDVCFDFSLFRVAVAVNTRETEHWQRKGGKRSAPRATSWTVTCYPLKIRAFTTQEPGYTIDTIVSTLAYFSSKQFLTVIGLFCKRQRTSRSWSCEKTEILPPILFVQCNGPGKLEIYNFPNHVAISC